MVVLMKSFNAARKANIHFTRYMRKLGKVGNFVFGDPSGSWEILTCIWRDLLDYGLRHGCLLTLLYFIHLTVKLFELIEKTE
jgi:hypothetical protein